MAHIENGKIPGFRSVFLPTACAVLLSACAGGGVGGGGFAPHAADQSRSARIEPDSPHNARAQRIFARIDAESREDE